MKMKTGFYNSLISILLIVLIIPGLMPEIITAADENDTGNNSTVNELPDLIIEDLSFDPVNPEPGQTVTITATVKNQGTASSGVTDVAYYSDGSYIGKSEVPEIEAGQNRQISLSWEPETEGTLEMAAKVDEEYLVEESNDENNQRTAILTVIENLLPENPLPDLIIEDIVSGSSAPQVGNLLNITLKVKNQGTASSEAVMARYYINGAAGQEDIYVRPLSAGEGASVAFSLTPNKEGQMEVRGLVDSGTAVYESDETNNGYTKIVNILAMPPDLTIESLSVNPEAPEPGENITFTVTVKNNGPGNSSRCELKYNINGINETSSGQITVPALSTGGTSTSTFFWTPTVEGQIEVKLTVDSGAVIREKDETNNEFTKIVNVAKTSSGGSSGSDSDSGSGSGSGSSSKSKSSSGGGAGGGSPEPASNVKVKELSQVFITSGKFVKFEFINNATAIISLSFDSKKTVGKTTTIVEMLKNKSTLTPDAPEGEIYSYLNIWVGNGGYGSDEDNLENAVINFRVEKSWMQDKSINKSSIILNRYSDKKWNELTTSLSGEDNKYLYFKAESPGFSPFAITGYNDIEENIEGNKTLTGKSIKGTLKGLEDEGKSILDKGVGNEGRRTTKPMGKAKILMAISLPLLMILIEYFILKKKL